MSPPASAIGHAELGAGLSQRAFGARQRQRQFPGLELDQRIADADLAADLHEDGADDARGFGADLRLVGREQRAGEIHLPLDRDALRGGGLDGDGRSRLPDGSGPTWYRCIPRSARAADRQRGTRENPVCDCHGPTAEMGTVSG